MNSYLQICIKNKVDEEFPSSSVIKTQYFHCLGPGLMPGQGSKIPQAKKKNRVDGNRFESHFTIQLSSFFRFLHFMDYLRTCLVVQWTRVQSQVQEDSTSLCTRTDEPAPQSPRAKTTEPESLEPVLCNKRSHRKVKSEHRTEEQLPFTEARESPGKATKPQCSQK